MELIAIFLGLVIAAGVEAILMAIVVGDVKLTAISLLAAMLFSIGWVCEFYEFSQAAYSMLGIGTVLIVLVAALWYSVEKEVMGLLHESQKHQRDSQRFDSEINGARSDVDTAETNAKETDGKIKGHEVEVERYIKKGVV